MVRRRLLTNPVYGWLLCVIAISLTGCYPSVPASHLPGIYHFSRAGYTTTLELKKDGTTVQTRNDPDGKSKVVAGTWRVGPLDGHITTDKVLEFYPEPGSDMSAVSFYTPEATVQWGKACLLVDGNKDLQMCK